MSQEEDSRKLFQRAFHEIDLDDRYRHAVKDPLQAHPQSSQCMGVTFLI